eukprot:TRINITY_DN7430_c0_g1_i2.p1 TRINITY_DN7430_c0_g1~~TRINITY_DN7430_c0_g1_i2.p1  ORF type:complete len:749 (+),score=155.24 TRINITY_DN7430_c0_g1_i2:85-2247(+)
MAWTDDVRGPPDWGEGAEWADRGSHRRSSFQWSDSDEETEPPQRMSPRGRSTTRGTAILRDAARSPGNGSRGPAPRGGSTGPPPRSGSQGPQPRSGSPGPQPSSVSLRPALRSCSRLSAASRTVRDGVDCCLYDLGIAHSPCCDFAHRYRPGTLATGTGRCSLAGTCSRHHRINGRKQPELDREDGCPWYDSVVEIHSACGQFGAHYNGRRGTVCDITNHETGLPTYWLRLEEPGEPSSAETPLLRCESFLAVVLEAPVSRRSGTGTAAQLLAGLMPRANWVCTPRWGWADERSCCEEADRADEKALQEHQPSRELCRRVAALAGGTVTAAHCTDSAADWGAERAAKAVGAALEQADCPSGVTVIFAEDSVVYLDVQTARSVAALDEEHTSALRQQGLLLRPAEAFAVRWATREDTTATQAAHCSVAGAQVLSALRARDGVPRRYVDATYGVGGHAAALLNAHPGHTVAAFDCDSTAEDCAQEYSRSVGEGRLQFRRMRWGELGQHLQQQGQQYDGFLMDCGITDGQHECTSRGICHWHDGPLDMRVDPTQRITAADVINYGSRRELEEALGCLKSAPFPKGMHPVMIDAILADRQREEISTTEELRNIMHGALKGFTGLRRDAKQLYRIVHQSLRCYANGDPPEIAAAVHAALRVLKKDGVLCVLTFRYSEQRALESALCIHEAATGERLVRLHARPTVRELGNNVRCSAARVWAITRS